MTLSQKALRVLLEIRHQSVGLSNRALRENFWWCFVKKQNTYLHKDYKYFCKYNFNELIKNLKLTQTGKF